MSAGPKLAHIVLGTMSETDITVTVPSLAEHVTEAVITQMARRTGRLIA